jgi:hypothetical protein
VEKNVNEILNRLQKTKSERFPDLAAEKESRDREERNEKKSPRSGNEKERKRRKRKWMNLGAIYH